MSDNNYRKDGKLMGASQGISEEIVQGNSEGISEGKRSSIGQEGTAVVILISYLAMLFLSGKTYHNYLQRDSVEWILQGCNILKHMAVGILLYDIPYEKIRNKVQNRLTSFTESWELGEQAGPISSVLILVCGYLGTGITLCACARAWDWGSNEVAYGAVIVTSLSLLALVEGIDLIRNKWRAAFYAAVLLFGNALFVETLTDKFTLAFIILVAETLVWIVIGYGTQKMDAKVLFVSAVGMGLLFFCLIGATNHWDKVQMFQEGFTTIPGEQLIERYETTGKLPLTLVYSNYLFTILKEDLGVAGWIMFGLSFALFSAAVMVARYQLCQESQKRAGVVLGIYLIFVVSALYGILSEYGILPISNVWLFQGSINIPLMIVGVRMFDLKSV